MKKLLIQCLIVAGVVGPLPIANGAPRPEIPTPPIHLTPETGQTDALSEGELVTAMNALARYLITLQDGQGAIIDPYLGREHQYSTPYVAAGLAALLHGGHAGDLGPQAMLAMDHATADFAAGHHAIPDGHGEFYLAPLALALGWFEGIASAAQLDTWRQRLSAPIGHIIEGPEKKINNWRSYAMKGEWLRAKAGLVERSAAIAFIEDGWLKRTQRARIVGDRWNLYQDWNGDPQSHAVEAVGRGNLLGLVASGYDGPSSTEIAAAVMNGTKTSLWLQSPDGQCPPNGRTDNHVFNDVLYGAIFATASPLAAASGDAEGAGQFTRAAALSIRSAFRWQLKDGPRTGSFPVTKNAFDPEERVGYQPASQYANYNATVLFHLAEALHALDSTIAPVPAPSEVGGFALEMDDAFGSAVINTGGLQVFANLRGDSVPKYGGFWTPLGIVRIARSDWDGRLGPADGVRLATTSQAATFGPAWEERGHWVSLAEKAADYRGTLSTDFVHPSLIRCTVLYAPVTGVGGPVFELGLTVTPDGVLVTLDSPTGTPLALDVPMFVAEADSLHGLEAKRVLLAHDGAGGDEQNVLIVDEGVEIEVLDALKSAVGWLRPLRLRSAAKTLRIFIYPRKAGEPDGQAVLDSFTSGEGGLSSLLGTVKGNQYLGRSRAGGLGTTVDLNGDGAPEL